MDKQQKDYSSVSFDAVTIFTITCSLPNKTTEEYDMKEAQYRWAVNLFFPWQRYIVNDIKKTCWNQQERS